MTETATPPRTANGRRVRRQINHGRDAVLDALDEGVHGARRVARRARFATEDVTDIAAVLLRRHPFRSAGVAFAAGAAIAIFARGMLARGCSET
jgi:hypothetical protein